MCVCTKAIGPCLYNYNGIEIEMVCPKSQPAKSRFIAINSFFFFIISLFVLCVHRQPRISPGPTWEYRSVIGLHVVLPSFVLIFCVPFFSSSSSFDCVMSVSQLSSHFGSSQRAIIQIIDFTFTYNSFPGDHNDFMSDWHRVVNGNPPFHFIYSSLLWLLLWFSVVHAN